MGFVQISLDASAVVDIFELRFPSGFLIGDARSCRNLDGLVLILQIAEVAGVPAEDQTDLGGLAVVGDVGGVLGAITGQNILRHEALLDQGVVVLNDLTEVVGDHEVADLAVLDVDALEPAVEITWVFRPVPLSSRNGSHQ